MEAGASGSHDSTKSWASVRVGHAGRGETAGAGGSDTHTNASGREEPRRTKKLGAFTPLTGFAFI